MKKNGLHVIISNNKKCSDKGYERKNNERKDELYSKGKKLFVFSVIKSKLRDEIKWLLRNNENTICYLARKIIENHAY